MKFKIHVYWEKTESQSNLLKKQHSSGPLPLNMDFCAFRQYHEYVHIGMFMSSMVGNNCLEVDGKVVLIQRNEIILSVPIRLKGSGYIPSR